MFSSDKNTFNLIKVKKYIKNKSTNDEKCLTESPFFCAVRQINNPIIFHHTMEYPLQGVQN